MNRIQRVMIISFAICLLTVAMTACSNNKTVLTVSNIEVPSGVIHWFLVKAYDAACNENGGVEGLWENKIEDKPTEDWILEKAQLYSAEYVAISNKFTEYGLTLASGDLDDIDSTIESYWNASGYSRYYEKYDIDEASFKNIITCNYKTDMIKSYLSASLEQDITKQDIVNYMKENGYLVKYIAIPMNSQFDAENATEEEIKDYKNVEEAYKELSERAKTENFDALVKEVSENTTWTDLSISSSYSDGMADTMIFTNDSIFTAAFRDALSNAETGEVNFFEDTAEDFYIIYIKEAFNEQWEGYHSFEDTVKSKLSDEAFDSMLTSWAEEEDVKFNHKGINVKDLFSAE